MSVLVLLPLLLLSTVCRANLLAEEMDLRANSVAGAEYRLLTNATPLTYELHLEPDLQNFVFKGQALIKIQMHSTVSELTLNAKNLNITAASTDEKGEKNVTKHINMTKCNSVKEEFVTITFNDTLKNGTEYVLNISYTGILNNDKTGFYRSKYLLPDGSLKYIATTQFEPTGARQAFPCWDEPAYKANFSISITHLNNYTAIANMLAKGQPTKVDDTRVKTTFKESHPMSTYLVAFVVSDYNKTQNKDGTFRVWSKAHAMDQTKYALELGEKVIQKLDDYTGIKYSKYMEKMDQISIKDFSAGAMENWGLVTYRETALLYEENVTTTASKQSIATIIAHEFAHQWFGNLVSPKWWKYIWLNEGFATYFQYFIVDQLEPSWRLMEVYVTDVVQGRAFPNDAGENTRPMDKDVDSPSQISALFDRIAYEKAGSIIRMMSSILTPEVFQKGLQKYLTEKTLSTAESKDLIQTLQTVADKKWEDKKFEEIMDAWINKAGYPVVTVNKTKDKLEITQKQFTLYNIGNNTNTKWWVPITFVQKKNPQFTNTTPVAWLDPTKDSKTISVDEDGWVIVNVNQTGYYRVNYDKDNWNLLTEYLKSKDYDKISPLNRAQLIDDAFNLARTNHLNYSVALSLASYLTKDKDYIPWNTAFRNLNFLDSKLQTTKAYPIFQHYFRYLMKELKKKVKYEPSNNSTHVEKILRTNLLKWGCRAQDEECMKYAQKEFSAWIKNSTSHPLNPDLKNNIICVGLKTADENKWNKTKDLLMKSTNDQDEKNALLPLMGCSGSLTILKKFLLSSLEKNSTIDFNIAVQTVISDHARGADLALDVITQETKKIKELDKADEKIKACIETLRNAITNENQYVKLIMFSAKMGAKPELVNSVVQKGMRNIEWMNSYSEGIGHWLTTHEDTFSNSAATLAFTSFLAIFSIFITRFY